MSTKILAGRYELIEKIGDGGMAIVYKSRDRLLNRFVAIKILKPEFTKDAKFIESFRRESQAAASLSHPNIVNVYDVGKESNIYYIVMELVEGETLSDVIKREGPLGPARAVKIAGQLASALSLAHKNHIIHRDVKPHNVLMTQEGTAKITDFGIAKAVNDATIVSSIGQEGTVIGSVHYFSPEQARGGYVDEKSDLYSLGIVLYEMLTGTVPFLGDNPVTVALMHINGQVEAPSKLNPKVPPALDAIVLKATDKYQINRYKSAEDMLQALKTADLSPSAGTDAKVLQSGALGNTIVLPASQLNQAQEQIALDPSDVEQKDHSFYLKESEKATMASRKNGKKRFRINKIKMGAILLAFLFAVPASQYLFAAMQGALTPQEIQVPGLIGLSTEEAESVLAELGLKLAVDDQVMSKEYDKGVVVSQNPEEGRTVKEGFQIQVNVSKGVVEGSVPNVVSKKLDDAAFILQNYGFVQGSISYETNELPKDVVIRQSPDAGSEAKPGSSVSLVLSDGAKAAQVEMPSLLGLSVDAARILLEQKNLTLGDVTYDASADYPENTVMRQLVAPGLMVDQYTTITLTVSTGMGTPGNKSVAIPISYEGAANEVFYLTVTVTDEAGNVRKVIDGEQRNRTDGDAVGTEMLSVSGQGSGTVRVIFDDRSAYEFQVNFDTGELR